MGHDACSVCGYFRLTICFTFAKQPSVGSTELWYHDVPVCYLVHSLNLHRTNVSDPGGENFTSHFFFHH